MEKKPEMTIHETNLPIFIEPDGKITVESSLNWNSILIK